MTTLKDAERLGASVVVRIHTSVVRIRTAAVRICKTFLRLSFDQYEFVRLPYVVRASVIRTRIMLFHACFLHANFSPTPSKFHLSAC